MFPWEVASHASGDEYPDGIEGVDPFARLAAEAASGASGQRPRERLAKDKARADHEPGNPRMGRRKLVTLLVAGTAGVITVVTVGGISFARSPQHVSHAGEDGAISTIPQKKRETGKDGDGARERDDDGESDGKRPHKKPTLNQTPPASPTAQPTQMPSPTATVPTPTGTVVGSTTQATNSVVAFTNPADGQASWLVRMSNGSFVAVEGACTHAGVQVKFNASTGQFNCPAHGAIFNADGTNPQAPANRPLPPVYITVNANGTITTP